MKKYILSAFMVIGMVASARTSKAANNQDPSSSQIHARLEAHEAQVALQHDIEDIANPVTGEKSPELTGAEKYWNGK